ncbi:hypothetical protein [Algoriphagus sp. Y33]|uniref:COG4705 family protein n=1 Tax=Algoriphagus sp. Y33 TaxID=2772483 RepID=UPI001780E676|nr:hypothetical protein [Algoriphagus sp. Y33]|tara:strand:+ start:46 stop:816 length:771 start_codon:yes stop_codon:yes gene_type:complete
MKTEIYSANKVAEITLLFWLMKIVATTLGETLGDYLSMTLNLGYLTGILITAGFFLTVLTVQLIAKSYQPIFYWLVIISTTTLGTEISDFMDRSLQLGYTWGSLILFGALLLTLVIWYIKFRTLAVYPIIDRKKEMFYWTAILFSNSLGTAFGDFLSDNLGFSYLQGALITASIILIVYLLHQFTNLNQIFLFWIAFVFTRPFGATFGDFLTKPVSKGGLDLGTNNASLVSLLLISVMIIISSRKQKSIGQSKNLK